MMKGYDSNVCLCTTCLPYPQGLVEGVRFPGAGVTESSESNQGPLEEHSVFLTTETSLQSPIDIF